MKIKLMNGLARILTESMKQVMAGIIFIKPVSRKMRPNIMIN